MSDNFSKTSGFGIGELGSVPESSPYDDMVASKIMQQAKQVDGKFEAFDLNRGSGREKYIFETMDEMLNFARDWTGFFGAAGHLSLYAPGYTVGYLLGYQLKWRKQIKLDNPVSGCDECGGDVRNGRCIQCGETDMISTSYSSWDNHEENLL